MYPRLKLLQKLLAEDGAIFISIDDNEQPNLRLICDEIFGAHNFAAQIIWEKVYSPRMDAVGFSNSHDYILCYIKGKLTNIKPQVFQQNMSQFNYIDEATGLRYRRRSVRKEGSHSTRQERPNLFFPLVAPDGSEVLPLKPDGTEGCWRWSKDTYSKNLEAGIVEWVKTANGWQVYAKQFLNDEATRPQVTFAMLLGVQQLVDIPWKLQIRRTLLNQFLRQRIKQRDPGKIAFLWNLHDAIRQHHIKAIRVALFHTHHRIQHIPPIIYGHQNRVFSNRYKIF